MNVKVPKVSSKFFDPHKSFLSLPIVKITVVTLITVSLAIAALIAFNAKLSFNANYDSFNFFFTVFRFPLAISALIIPLVALLAANHRSEQTKEQIRVTNSQNVFSNYYKHLEEFIKYAQPIAGNKTDVRFLHHRLFPDASTGNYSVNPNLLNLLSELDKVVAYTLQTYPSDPLVSIDSSLKEHYQRVASEIYSHIYRERKVYARQIDNLVSAPDKNNYLLTSVEIVAKSQQLVGIIERYCNFSIGYSSPIKYLNSEALNVSSVYIHQKSQEYKNIDVLGQKPEQTLEEANNKWLSQLNSALNL